MSFPKKGKFFPNRGTSDGGGPQGFSGYAAEIASALHGSLGSTGAGIKIAAGWTGANEKTVKNWFSGRYGPSGEHLTILVHHSDAVLKVFLTMAGRQDLLVAIKLAAAERAVEELLAAIRNLTTPAGDEE